MGLKGQRAARWEAEVDWTAGKGWYHMHLVSSTQARHSKWSCKRSILPPPTTTYQQERGLTTKKKKKKNSIHRDVMSRAGLDRVSPIRPN